MNSNLWWPLNCSSLNGNWLLISPIKNKSNTQISVQRHLPIVRGVSREIFIEAGHFDESGHSWAFLTRPNFSHLSHNRDRTCSSCKFLLSKAKHTWILRAVDSLPPKVRTPGETLPHVNLTLKPFSVHWTCLSAAESLRLWDAERTSRSSSSHRQSQLLSTSKFTFLHSSRWKTCD